MPARRRRSDPLRGCLSAALIWPARLIAVGPQMQLGCNWEHRSALATAGRAQADDRVMVEASGIAELREDLAANRLHLLRGHGGDRRARSAVQVLLLVAGGERIQ